MKVGPEILFFIFAGLIALPVVYLIFTSNLIRAAFAFAFSLLALAGLYAFMEAGFMAVVQILIYAGGVVVLLMFGVMLSKSSNKAGVYTGHQYVIFGAITSLALFFSLIRNLQSFSPPSSVPVSELDTTSQIGILLLTDHLLVFELIAYLLLVVLVGASFISKKMTE